MSPILSPRFLMLAALCSLATISCTQGAYLPPRGLSFHASATASASGSDSTYATDSATSTISHHHSHYASATVSAGEHQPSDTDTPLLDIAALNQVKENAARVKGPKKYRGHEKGKKHVNTKKVRSPFAHPLHNTNLSTCV